MRYLKTAFIPAALVPAAALAQADANAVRSAGDAFGYRRGDEAVGIYDERSVRGFSLEAAGNYRLNGTYFVKNSGISNFFIESSTVRIGYNTLGLGLPGPSGVVDYRLRDPAPGERSLATLSLEAYGQPIAELNLRHRSRTGDRGYSIGASRNFDVRNYQGGKGGEDLLLAGIGRLSTGAVTSQLFAGEYQYRRRGEFRVVPTGGMLPPEIARGRYLGQDWAFDEGQRRIAGLLVDAEVGDGLGVGTTLAFGQEDPSHAFLQFLGDVRPDGSARADLVAIPQQRSTALSGEARAHAERRLGLVENRLDATVRLRRSTARFGGARTIGLGRVRFGEAPAPIAEPELDEARADQRTLVDQWGIGLSYRGEIAGRVRANAGVLKTDYAKELRAAGSPDRRNSSAPWLYNAGLALNLTPDLEVYGGYARGLEEAGVAPTTAANRNEILDAIVVTQRELGLRWVAASGLNVALAGFDTRKPYAGLDQTTNRFRFLGDVRHRGVEASISGRVASGVQLVIGGVWLDPELEIALDDDMSRVLRPVAVPRLRSIASLDAQLPWLAGVNVDAAVTHVGRRAARSMPDVGGDQLRVPSLTTLNIGARYSFAVNGHDLVLRAQLLNVTNRYEWDVNASETLAYNEPRRARLLLTTRF